MSIFGQLSQQVTVSTDNSSYTNLASGAIQNNTNFSIDLKGIPFYNGLFFVLSGSNENITVIYE